ncbi:MAG TPA: M20/M25/M40 family metallo-hydrolase, partial [Acidobacteriaceae bacterium]|nr:M20/M25/M40 family metallo-hydrolase [Acidobacteriaceae bacterium]
MPKARGTPEKPVAGWMQAAVARQMEMLKDLETLVAIESPSDNKDAVDRASEFAANRLQGLGGKVRRHRQKQFGDVLEVRFGGGRPRSTRPLLLLGHLDTVWPMGTLRGMPYRVDRGRAFGPGVYDMKAGVVMAVHALGMLLEASKLTSPVILLLNSEEEVGSPCSRAITEKTAAECSAVFVLEPAQGTEGAYKTARKGVGHYTVQVQGVAAHSGVDFEKGHSAILELARLLEKISHFTD